MKQKNNQKPLFDLGSKQDKTTRHTNKKHDISKKEDVTILKGVKTETKMIKQKHSEQSEIKKPKTGWKSFGKTMEQRPEPLVPCEFKFVTSKNEEFYMYGFIGYDGLIGTDNPYVLNRLKEKATKFLYRQLDCRSIDICPNGFPNCEKCKGVKT